MAHLPLQLPATTGLKRTLPGYQKTFTQVQQPKWNGGISAGAHNNSSLNLAFSQSITPTGGKIYGATELQRFDDFDRKNTLYNAIPYTIGYSHLYFSLIN